MRRKEYKIRKITANNSLVDPSSAENSYQSFQARNQNTSNQNISKESVEYERMYYMPEPEGIENMETFGKKKKRKTPRIFDDSPWPEEEVESQNDILVESPPRKIPYHIENTEDSIFDKATLKNLEPINQETFDKTVKVKLNPNCFEEIVDSIFIIGADQLKIHENINWQKERPEYIIFYHSGYKRWYSIPNFS